MAENKSFKYACLFGGGAIRGAAYCGTVKAMTELGIEPEIVAGSSVGSIIAAFGRRLQRKRVERNLFAGEF